MAQRDALQEPFLTLCVDKVAESGHKFFYVLHLLFLNFVVVSLRHYSLRDAALLYYSLSKLISVLLSHIIHKSLDKLMEVRNFT